MGVTKRTLRLTSKGQFTLPKAVRDRLGVKPGEPIDLFEENGQIVLRRHFDEAAFRAALDRVSGTVDLGGKTVDEWIDEMRGE